MTLRKSIWYLIVALVILNVADFMMTKSFIIKSGSIDERNPMMHSAIEALGINSILMFKLLAIAAFAGLIYIKRSVGIVLYSSVAALDIIFVSLVFYEIYWSPFRG